MTIFRCAIIGTIALGLMAASPALGRGFGGVHGGGGLGGYHGGGFHAGQTGGFHGQSAGAYKATGPRGTQVEGVHEGSYGGFQHEGAGGFHGGAAGGYREGGYGAYGRTGGAYREGGYGGFHEATAGVGGYRGGEAGAYREGGYGAYHGEAAGGYRQGTVPTRGNLNQFLGLPTDAGLSAAGHGAVGAAGYRGGYYAAGHGYAAGYGIHYGSPAIYRSQALAVRNNFYGYHLFTPGWYGAHPYAWTAAGLTAAAWAVPTWSSVGSWFDLGAPPVYYDYGNTITYADGNVYSNLGGEQTTTAAEYYQQANSLADSGSSDTAPQDNTTPWLPLGVFGLVQADQKDASMIVQLAVNKAGILRGNFYSEISDTTLPVHGAVDRKTQRAAWTVGSNKATVFDTGLYNLTKDEAPVLVHVGKAKTQQWLLVRMKQTAKAK